MGKRDFRGDEISFFVDAFGDRPRAMGVHRGQRESRVQGRHQAPFMMDEPLCIQPAVGRSPVKAVPILYRDPWLRGRHPCDDAPSPLFYGTSRVLMLLFKGSIVRNLIKEGDERT